MDSFDIIWIGTGQASGTSIPLLSQAGLSIAVLETGRFGGTCVNTGCTPTKTLVAGAGVARSVERASEYGLDVLSWTVDFLAAMSRQNRIRHANSEKLEKMISGLEGVKVFRGFGRFIDEHRVEILRSDGTVSHEISGRTIVIHTGTSSRIPSIPGLDAIPVLDNAGILDLEDRPEHLLIIGGSYTGLEFAQIFRRFGSRVTVFEAAPHILSKEDPDTSDQAVRILEKEGIRIVQGAKIVSFSGDGGRDIVIEYEEAGTLKRTGGTCVLVAAGRIPNTSGLLLEKAGIDPDERGFIRVNDRCQTVKPHIYALGDVNGKGAFTHTSVNDGEIFIDHYLGRGDRKISDRIPIYAMYTDPPLGRIGISESEARESGKDMLMAVRSMESVNRAVEKGETDGFLKIIAEAETGLIAGATVFGTGGDEVINLFAPLMQARIPYWTLRRTVMAHPTVSEIIPWILDGLKPLA